MPTITFVFGDAVLTRPRVAVPAVFVIVQVMRSPLAGVTEKDVPAPDGKKVEEPDAAFEHEMLPAYWPSAETEPDAMVSLRV